MIERDKRRRFTKRQRTDAWLYQNGKSAVSGKPVGPDFHADHCMPWSKGGKTSIENCQVLTPAENLKKGSKMQDRRFLWQDEFVQTFLDHTEPNFFLCALPGGGKTRASARVIRDWIDDGGVVVIVVPTRAIRRNWRTQLRKININLDQNYYGALREGYHGIVTTYQAIAGQKGVFKKLCIDQSVLLVCDEIHHASEDEDSTWGSDLREAFELAKRRLLLSGTPVRTDRETTSFLTLEDDPENPGKFRYKMHYKYDWPRALSDHVVRPITFHRVNMDHVDVEFPDGRKRFCTDDDAFLSYALDDRRFLLAILRDANDCLDTCRRTDRTAGAIAVCKNIGHARTVFECLELLGQNPTMVNCDEDDALDRIDDFDKDDTKRWLIAVRMVSEGVDVPRLRVEAYLTNAATDLIFRQLVGRCVRRREHEEGEDANANIFIPNVPDIVRWAEKIEKMQALAKKKDGGGGNGNDPQFGLTIGGAQPSFIGYIIHGQQYVGDRASVIKQLMEKYEITARSASKMLNDPNFAKGFGVGETASDDWTTGKDEAPWDIEKRLKDDCNSLVSKLVDIRMKKQGHLKYDRAIYQRFVKDIHFEFRIDRTSQGELNISQLQRKKDALINAVMREESVNVE